jgi:aspartyl-tRNA(Asn)/glutamyl-tRNA(Gln) amidotransferase subunit B
MSTNANPGAPMDAEPAGAAGSGVTVAAQDRGAWEAVIGLEIHVQMSTRTKMFCGCEVTFGEPPNTHVCPVCLGHPGVLPVTNEKAVEYATRIALALSCRVAERTIFHRKNYFYPDLPKAYQISQYDLPLGIGGYLDAEAEDGTTFRVGITRVHMEEDAGKLVHAGGASGRIDGADYSLVDFNRGGTPLVEIVTEPDIATPEQARVFLTQLRSLIQQLGVSDVNMEEGSLRCDANVSVRRPGGPLGTKTELKNVNSFRFVQRGLEAEIERQIELLESGERVVQATVHFDPGTGTVSTLRSKEEAHDYRYFPEPDLAPIELDEAYVQRVRETLPELPAARKERLMRAYELPSKDAAILSANKALGDYFETVTAATGDSRVAANWVLGDLSAYLNAAALEVTDSAVGPEALAGLLGLVADGTLSGKMAKEVFEAMTETGKDAGTLVAEKGLGQISDAGELDALIARIVEANPGPAEEFRQGRDRVLGFFVGQVMKETRGQANPQMVNDILRRQLGR